MPTDLIVPKFHLLAYIRELKTHLYKTVYMWYTLVIPAFRSGGRKNRNPRLFLP